MAALNAFPQQPTRDEESPLDELARLVETDDQAALRESIQELKAVIENRRKVGRITDVVGGKEFVIPIESREQRERAVQALEGLNIVPWEENGLLIIEHRFDMRKLELADIVVSDLSRENIPDGLVIQPGEYVFPFPKSQSLSEALREVAHVRTKNKPALRPPVTEETEDGGIDTELKNTINRFDQGLVDDDDPEFRGRLGFLPTLKLFPRQYVWKNGVVVEKLTGHEVTSEEHEAFLRNAKEGGVHAMTKLIRMHTGLVLDSVMRVKKKLGGDADDLFQEGLIGLMRAIQLFDPQKEDKSSFSTYARLHIEARIRRYATQFSLPISRSADLIKNVSRFRSVERGVTNADGIVDEEAMSRSLNAHAGVKSQVHDHVGIERLRTKLLLNATFYPLSDEEDTRAASTIEPPSPYDSLNQRELEAAVTRVFSTLTPREEMILRLRFGIGKGESVREHSYEELGERFFVTRERIRQIEARAMRRLRHPIRARSLRWFLDLPDDS